MTRDEFLNRLGELLACLPADQVKETQEFYAEVIADRMEDGMTEAEAVAAMGTLGEVAEATLDELPAVPRAIARTKRKSTALLWALAIVGSPVWIPLLLAFVAVAAAAVAVAEYQPPLHVLKEYRVGGACFPLAGHRRNALQRSDVQRPAAAEVN